MDKSWIKIYRKIVDWEYYTDSHMVHLFIHLICKANVNDVIWQGIAIKRGQLITGRSSLSNETGISPQSIRTCLSKLKKSGYIEIETTHHFTLVTINDYENYVEDKIPTTRPIETKQEAEMPMLFPATAPPKKKRKASTTKSPTIVTQAREIFEAYFKELYGENYYWTAKDAAAMKKLLDKIRFNRQNKPTPLPIDDKSLCDAFGIFLHAINKGWILKNFSVTKISSQYNEIVSEIKNRRNGYNGDNRTAKERLAGAANLVNKYLSED